MITSVTLLVLSLFALYIGAGWLVKGSTEIALKAKISNLVIGLTIVAFGTSAPELVVSLNASLSVPIFSISPPFSVYPPPSNRYRPNASLPAWIFPY